MRFRHFVKALSFVAVAGLSWGASARTWYVSPSGMGDGSGWGSETDVATAVAQAGNGDAIWLLAGTYELSDTLVTDKAIAMVGGFAGTEAAEGDRAGGDVRSVLTGADTAGSSCVQNTCGLGVDYTVRFDGIAFRHGNYHGLDKSGFSRTEIVNCEFSGNGWGPTGNSTFVKGRGASIVSTDFAASCRLTNCVFSNNLILTSNSYGGSDGGAGLYVAKHGSVVVTDTNFIGNGLPQSTQDWAPGRDQQTRGGGLYAQNSRLAATNCVFVGNRITGNGGGDGGSALCIHSDNSGTPADGSVLSHCLVVGNETCRYSSGSVAQYGAVAILHSAGSHHMTIDHCTIAYNLAPCGKAAGLTVYQGTVDLRNSIVWGNIAEASIALGCDLYVNQNNTHLTVSDSLIGGKEPPYAAVEAGKTTGEIVYNANVITADPLFATSAETAGNLINPASVSPYNSANTTKKMTYTVTAHELLAQLDLHLKSAKGRWNGTEWVTDAVVSPALDAAAEDDDWSLEPEPNGGRANLGYYGGTAEASKNQVSIPVIETASVALQPNDYTRPYLSMALASDENLYSATVTFCCGTELPEGTGKDGWQYQKVVSATAAPGDSFAAVPGIAYLPQGTAYWRVVVEAGAHIVTQDGTLAVTGNLPPQWGRGGGDDVIHVWAGGQGTRGGTSWLDACATLAEAAALVTETRTNIWIAGTVPSGAKGNTVHAPIVMLGGFTGMENAPEDRAEGAMAVVDGERLNDGLTIDPTLKTWEYTACTSVVGDVVFTNMYGSALTYKTRSNALVRDCLFTRCGYDENDNIAMAVHVDASASDTCVLIENCRFRDCFRGIGGGADGYNVRSPLFWFNSARQVDVKNCTVTGCGVARTDIYNVSRGREAVCGWLVETKVPVSFEGCRFAGNVMTTHKNGHALFRFASGSAGSSFRNCSFLGNVGQKYDHNGVGFSIRLTSLCVFESGSASDAYAFDSCTFGYNVQDGGPAPLFAVKTGSVRVSNSILWGNSSITNDVNNCVMEASAALVQATTGSIAFNWCLTDDREGYPLAAVSGGATDANVSIANCRAADPLFVSSTDDVLQHLKRETKDGGGNTWYLNRILPPGGTAAATALTADLDCHLRGRGGYVDETTGETVVWKGDDSPAIDAGDPNGAFAFEPRPNGGRLNLGCYGNTPWATCPYVPAGTVFYFR